MGTLPTDLAEHLREVALQNGALLVGLTKIRRTEPVIIFAFPFTENWFFNHPFALSKKLGKEYLASKHVQNLVAKILQTEGYRAEYKTILSLFGDFRPLAVSAGLGHWGRNGLVVTKDYGSNVLFSAIFTNAPLEIITLRSSSQQNPKSNCLTCNHCVDACPGNAFADGKFYLHRCLPFALRGCGECVKNCYQS